VRHTKAIGVSHRANKFFNDLVRTQIHGADKAILEPGDLMMVTRNWSRNGVFLCNGDQVEIIEVDWNSVESVEDLTFIAIKFRPLFSDQIVDDLLLVESVTSIGANIDQEKFMKLVQSRYIKNKIFRDSENPEDDKYIGSIKLMYGHSITCHKAQGGEWDKVYINSWGIPSLKWQYTAVTRGVSNLEHF
jgi:exodeoxyribonuclease-5